MVQSAGVVQSRGMPGHPIVGSAVSDEEGAAGLVALAVHGPRDLKFLG